MKKKVLTLVLSLALVFTMMPVSSFADNKVDYTEFLEGALQAATLDTEVENTQAGAVMAAALKAMARQPEEKDVLLKEANRLIDAIALSENDGQALAIGYLGETYLLCIAHQPEAYKGLRKAVDTMLVGIALATSEDKASAIGYLAGQYIESDENPYFDEEAAGALCAIAVQPEVANDVNKIVKKAVDAILLQFGESNINAMSDFATRVAFYGSKQPETIDHLLDLADRGLLALGLQVDGWKSYAIADMGMACADMISKRPEKANDALKLFDELATAVTLKTGKSAAGIENIGVAAFEAIARQPEMVDYIIQEVEKKLVVLQTVDKKYIVTFVSLGGEDIDPMVVEKGEYLDLSFIDGTCYFDAECTREVGWDYKVSRNMKLYVVPYDPSVWDDSDSAVKDLAQMLLSKDYSDLKAIIKDEYVMLEWDCYEYANGFEIYADGELVEDVEEAQGLIATSVQQLANEYNVKPYLKLGDTKYYAEELFAQPTLGKVKVKSVTRKDGKVTVKYKKVSGAQTYEVRYKIGKGKWKTVSAKKLSKTFKAKGTVKVKVRAVYAAGEVDVVGPWSKVKTLKKK
ncbi:MAG: ATP synthase F0 subunit C [Clostridia bacterium]|nr:ATP synthase F0 subunit C [Clostridia bacterium]